MLESVFSATETRANFFDVLNRVLYANEKVFVRKSGADHMVRMERVPMSEEALSRLAGRISDKDAKVMKKTINEAHRRLTRRVPVL